MEAKRFTRVFHKRDFLLVCMMALFLLQTHKQPDFGGKSPACKRGVGEGSGE